MKLRAPLQKLMFKLPNSVTLKAGRSALLTKKHSPAILFGAGVIGFGATVVLACRATIKMDPLTEEAHKRVEAIKADETTTAKTQKKELTVVRTAMLVETLKLYGPAVLVGLGSVCALTGSHIVLTKRNVALTAGYATLEQFIDQYRKRVSESLGDEKEGELYRGIVETDIVEETEDGPVVTKGKRRIGGSPYSRLFDETNKNWQRERNYNVMFLSSQQVHADNLLKTRGYVFLNDVLKALGMPQCYEGQMVGWVKGSGKGDDFIDFGIYSSEHMGEEFVSGYEKSVWLDFNVQGNILDKVDFRYSD
jgi:hypothetical protein